MYRPESQYTEFSQFSSHKYNILLIVTMDTNTPRAESQYNLNERITTLIADMQEEAFTLSSTYKLNDSFDKWQSIRLLIEARFNEPETDKLDSLEEEFLEKIIITYPHGLSTSKPMYGLSSKDSYIKKEGLRIKKHRLNKYVKYIMILMRLYKIGMTDKEKITRLT